MTGPALLPPPGRAGPMSWVVAIMTTMSVLAAAAGLALGGAARGMTADLAGRVTVQIVTSDRDARTAQTAAAVAALRATPGVARAEPVPDAELWRLVAPWLGRDGLGPDIPLPALIDVTLGDASPRVEALRARLAPVAPDARVDTQGAWIAPVASLIDTLRWLAVAIVALALGAMSAAVTLAVRAGLTTHRATLEVMHLMGATDAQVARLFQGRAARDAGWGAAIGTVAGAALAFLVAGRIGATGTRMIDTPLIAPSGYALLALVPVGAVVIAMIAARLTVLRAMGQAR